MTVTNETLPNSGTGFVDYSQPGVIPNIADTTSGTNKGRFAKDLRSDTPASLNRRSGSPELLYSDIWGKNGWYMNGPRRDPFNAAKSEANIVASYVQSFTTQGKENVLGDYQRMLIKYGHTNSPGVLLALAEAQIPDEDPTAQQILSQDATLKAQQDAATAPGAAQSVDLRGDGYTSFWDRIWPDDMWKGPQAVSRNFFALMQLSLQGIQATERSVGGQIAAEQPLMDKITGAAASLSQGGIGAVGFSDGLLNSVRSKDAKPLVNPWAQTDFIRTLSSIGDEGWNAFWGAQAGLDITRAQQVLMKDPKIVELSKQPGGTEQITKMAEDLAKEKGWYGNEGWFIDETSRVGQATMKSAFDAWAIPGPDNQMIPWTKGRGIVGATRGPDSNAYGVLSGFIDAYFAIVEDPLTYVDGIGVASKIVAGTGKVAEILSKGKIASEGFLVGKEALKASAKDANVNRQILKAAEATGTTPEELAAQSLRDTLNMVRDARKADATSEVLSAIQVQGQQLATTMRDYVRQSTATGKITSILDAETQQAVEGIASPELQRAISLWDDYVTQAWTPYKGQLEFNSAGNYDAINALRQNPEEYRLFGQVYDLFSELVEKGVLPEDDTLAIPAFRQFLESAGNTSLQRGLQVAPEEAATQAARLLSDPEQAADLQYLAGVDYMGARAVAIPGKDAPVIGVINGQDSILYWSGEAAPVVANGTDVIDDATKVALRKALEPVLADPIFDAPQKLIDPAMKTLASQVGREINNITDVRSAAAELFANPNATFEELVTFASKVGLDGVMDDMFRSAGFDGVSVVGQGAKPITWFGEHPNVVAMALPDTVKEAAGRLVGVPDLEQALQAAPVAADGVLEAGLRGMSPAELRILAADSGQNATRLGDSLIKARDAQILRAEVAEAGLTERLARIDDIFSKDETAVKAALGWEMGLRSGMNTSLTVDEAAVRRTLFGNSPFSYFANRALTVLGTFVPESEMAAAMKAGVGSEEYSRVFQKAAGSIAIFTKNKWSPEVVAAVARNAIEGGGKEGLIRILTPHLGIDVTRGTVSRTISAIGTDGKTYFRSWRRPSSVVARALGQMPGLQKLDITSPEQTIDAIIRYGTYAKLPDAQIATRIGKIVEASGTARVIGVNRRQLLDTFNDISDTLLRNIDESKFAGSLYKGTAGEARLNEIKTAIFESSKLYVGGEQGQIRTLQEIAATNSGLKDLTTASGEKIPSPDINLETEIATGYVTLPNVDEWRDALSRFSLVVSRSKIARSTADMARRFFDNFFRTSMLALRVAFGLRNIGEMEVRMFLNGHKSMLSDPLTMFGMTFGNFKQAKYFATLSKREQELMEELPASLVGKARREEVNRLLQDEFPDFTRRFNDMIAPYSQTVLGTAFEAGTDEALAVANQVDNYQAIVRFAHSLTDPRMYNAGVRQKWTPIGWGAPRFYDGWAHELIMLERSGLARLVTRGAPPDVARTSVGGFDAFKDGAVDWLLGESKDATRLRDLMIGADDKFAAVFDDRAATMQYLFDNPFSVYNRVLDFTNADESLIQYIATGKLTHPGGSFNPQSLTQPGERISQFASILKRNYSGESWKQHFTTRNVEVPWVDSLEKTNGVNLFNWFFDKTNKIERLSVVGPEYRQAYWDMVAQLAPGLNAAEVPRALAAARTTLGPLKRLRNDGSLDAFGRNHPAWSALKKARDNQTDGLMTLDEIHAIACEYAAEEVSKLFYDAAKRNNLWYQMRLVFPFGQAWGNTAVTWSKLAAKNPIRVYKAQKAFNAMIESGSSAVYEFGQELGAYGQYAPGQAPWEQTANGGFFYTDQYGETSFVYPYLGRAAAGFVNSLNWMSGRGWTGIQDMAITSPVSSLNVAMSGDSVLPGVSPLAAAPLSTGILPDNEVIDNLRQIASPFGDKNLAESNVPAWFAKLLSGVGGIPVVGEMVGDKLDFLAPGNKEKYVRDAMLILQSTGKYDITDPVSANQMQDDAKGLAKTLLLTTGLIQNVLPSTPIPATSVEIPEFDGTKTASNTALYTIGMMNSMFQQYRERNGFDDTAAREEWVKDFGPAALFATTGDWKNFSRIPTSDALRWARKQGFSEAARANIDEFTLFFPRGDSSDVAAADWISKYGKGDRVRKTSQEMFDEIIRYLQSVQKLRIQSMEANGLINDKEADAAREDIKQRYQDVAKISGTYFDKTQELEKIKSFYDQNEVMSETPAAPAFEQAWKLREAALNQVRTQMNNPNAGLGSKRAAPVLAWYTSQINALVQQYPDFALLASKFRKEWD